MSCFLEVERHKSGLVPYFAGSVKIKKDPMELLSTKECEKKTLCQWYERFSEVAKEIEDITSHEKIAF